MRLPTRESILFQAGRGGVSNFDWQSVMWYVPNTLEPWWSWSCGIAALIAAIMLFLRVVLRAKCSWLVLFRSMYILGLFAIFLAGLNSGWQRWIEPLFAFSGLGLAVIYFFNLHRGGTLPMPMLLRPFGRRPDQEVHQ